MKKRAIITGGAGLIGAGLCQALTDRGWEVAAFDLKPASSGARSVLCDVGDEASVTAAYAELGWSELDLLVNNAGGADPTNGPLPDVSRRHPDAAGRGQHHSHDLDPGDHV